MRRFVCLLNGLTSGAGIALLLSAGLVFSHSSVAYEEDSQRGNLEQIQDVFLRDQILAAEDAFTRGNKNSAVAILRNVVAQYPKSDFANFMLGTYLLVRDAYDGSGKIRDPLKAQEGLGYLQKAVNLSPNTVGYQFSYAVVLGEVRRDKESVSIFERYWASNKTYRVHPRYRHLVVNYADSLLRLGLRDHALEELRRSVEATNGDKDISSQYMRVLSDK